MNWEPARADHSIDTATAAITLLEPVDPNTFDELLVAGRKAAAALSLTDRLERPEAIELAQAPDDGAVIELSASIPPRRVIFRRLDAEKKSVDELSIGSQRIAIGTRRYRRWSEFFKLLTESIRALEQVYPVTSSIKSVRLQYVDRFVSTQEAGDHFEILNRDSEHLTAAVKSKDDSLHVHSGWFDFEVPMVRKLTNINIDVADIVAPPRRRVSVLTMAQFEALDGNLDRPVERLGSLHTYLHNVYGGIITVQAAERVALND